MRTTLWPALSMLCAVLLSPPSAHTQYAKSRTSSEIKLALDQLQVVGSILYIAAHPDDENTAFLAAMAKGRGMRTAYLSVTRGEGGQNLIGPEQGAALGVIRTQELLAARSVDGAGQYFTRAVDFGFSKSTDETMRFWNHDSTLADVVRIIRTFRPDVIVMRFTPTLGGHGNHTASGVLAMEAFDAAADPAQFPEQLRTLKPWKTRRLFWNVFRPDSVMPAGTVRIDLGSYAPLLGRSFAELAGLGRSMHKSQGFGASQNRGEAVNTFQIMKGDTAANDLFDGIATGWQRFATGSSCSDLASHAAAAFTINDPAACVPDLIRFVHALDALPDGPDVRFKKTQALALIQSCAGFWLEYTTTAAQSSPGTQVSATLLGVNRSTQPFTIRRIRRPFAAGDSVMNTVLAMNKTVRIPADIAIPASEPPSQQYWLKLPQTAGFYRTAPDDPVGTPLAPDPCIATVELAHPAGTLTLAVPLMTRRVDPVEGEIYDPFPVVPPASIRIAEAVVLFPAARENTVHVSVRPGNAAMRGSLHLTVPPDWRVSPASVATDLQPRSGDTTFTFRVTPGTGAKSGTVTAELDLPETTVTNDITTISYRHIPRQLMLTPARARLVRAQVISPGGKAAYIMGAGDDVPPAIEQLGYTVTSLSDEQIATADLTVFDVIVAGIRAYNTRPVLRRHHARFIRYAEQGGTYVVQYMTPQRGEADNIGPYPLTVSRDRVAEEDAQISFIMPRHPVLSSPNTISQADFPGWVQERGLSYADKWDARYDSILAAHDQGEPDRKGGLLVARTGKGWYVYTGLAFFRQLPAGVEGAFRLFANILALRKDTQHAH
jgi:LmbE family N-acetylglucosaminyl deacetylase